MNTTSDIRTKKFYSNPTQEHRPCFLVVLHPGSGRRSSPGTPSLVRHAELGMLLAKEACIPPGTPSLVHSSEACTRPSLTGPPHLARRPVAASPGEICAALGRLSTGRHGLAPHARQGTHHQGVMWGTKKACGPTLGSGQGDQNRGKRGGNFLV
nr:unnamed protein product [Digitaria exilis]